LPKAGSHSKEESLRENCAAGFSQEEMVPQKMRPQSYEEVIGQAIWHPNSPLHRLVTSNRFSSLIFWGPPGCGKTSLARVIGKAGSRGFVELSAVSAGVKDIRQVIDASLLQPVGARTLLFVDEFHRLSRNQQDVLLPALEQGAIQMIGATTENPSFCLNHAVLSRSLVFRFDKLSLETLVLLLQKAFLQEKATRYPEATLEESVYLRIAQWSDGDARKSLQLLDTLLATHSEGLIGEEAARSLESFVVLPFDRKGDFHYDLISALIKSIRGSEPQAALYYLARILEGGEDPTFVARRLIIASAEDIGMASPQALGVAVSGATACAMLGMPEARIILGEVVVFLATCPKSNRSYVGYEKALADVKKWGDLSVPLSLRNGVTDFMKTQGYGKGYVYAHDDPAGAKAMKYLPKEVENARYYEPSANGYEGKLPV